MTTAENVAEAVQTESLLIGEKEAARLCGIGRTAWRSHVDSGKTPAPIRLGRRVLWLRDEITAWCRAGCPSREKWLRQNNKKI